MDSLRLDLSRPAPLLLDGALGTQLLASGFDLERDWLGRRGCCEALALTRPEQLRAVHESYFDAGSDLVGTASFGALASSLAAVGLEGRASEIVRAAVEAARQAAVAWSSPERPRGVIGVLGPGNDLPSRGGRGRDQLVAEYRDLAAELTRHGVDLLLLETCADPSLVAAAAEGARAGSNLPLWISLAPDAGVLMGGFDPLETLAAARDHAPQLLALNCGRDPEQAAATLPVLRSAWDGPLGFWPAASEDGSPGDPFAFAATVAQACTRFDLRAVGGCCGSGPVHVRRLAAALGLPGPEDDWYDALDHEDEDEEEDFDDSDE